MAFNKLSSTMQVNQKLLPIKGHYFFFNAGTAPLVPYLSTYARQLGFSSSTVGLIYTVLPIFGLIAKPIFGIVADRFKIQKFLFILFQIVTIISFSAIYFVPGDSSKVSIALDCDYGASMLKSCYANNVPIDMSKIKMLGKQNTTSCDMNCEMSTPKMWQTVCEHWHMPKYCYSNTESIEFTTRLDSVTVKDNCGYISTYNVTLDGYSYMPGCHQGISYIDFDEPCKMHCINAELTKALGSADVNMTCLNQTLYYRSCGNASALGMLPHDTVRSSECEVYCDLEKSTPWILMEICEGWEADDAATCHPKTEEGHHFPKQLSFTGVLSLSSTIQEHDCVYVELRDVILADGSVHYPYCLPNTKYDKHTELFESFCTVSCESEMLNEVFLAGFESNRQGSPYTRQFWLFFLMMIISWVGQAVVVTFADAICFNLLGTKVSLFGKQRLWGSVGWGIFSLVTGTLIDAFSDGAYKDYTVAFVLMFIFLTGDVVVSCLLKVESTQMSMNILVDVGTMLSSLPTVVFLLWTIAVGVSTGLLWQFLFWLLEDVSAATTNGSEHIKTLQGLVSAIQMFGGEIPFMFVSGYILRKIGHVNTMSIVLFAFGIRFILYSFLTNPWWVLPIEMLQGITFGMFYPTMTSYATIVSPAGTETTVQGLVGAVFEGVGTSLGSYIGGRLYEEYGGANTFSWFGYCSLVLCFIHIVVQYFLKTRITGLGVTQAYSTVIRYEPPNDMVHMLEDMGDSRVHDA